METKRKVWSKITPLIKKIDLFRLNNTKVQKLLLYSILGFLFLLAFIVFALYAIRPFNYVAIGIAIIEVLLIGAYVILFGHFVFNVYQFLMILFYICQIVSFVANGCRHIDQTPLLVAAFGVVLSEFYSQDNIPKRAVFWMFFAAGCLFEILFATFEINAVLHPDFSIRAGGMFGNENDVGRNFALISFLCIGFTFEKGKPLWLRIVCIVPALLAFYFVILTGSVSNVLSILIVMIIYLFIKTPKKQKWIFIFGLIALILIIVFVLQIPALAYFKKRIVGMFNALDGDGLVDASFVSRWNIALHGLTLFLESPLVGHGQESITFYSDFGTTHNNFTDLLSYYGIVAFLCYQCIVLIPSIVARKKKKIDNQSMFLIIIYTFVFQLFLYSYDFKADMMMIPLAYFLLNDSHNWNQLFTLLGYKRKMPDKSKMISSADYYLLEI